MDIYDLIYEISESNDLADCGRKLLVYADKVFAQKNRSPYINKLFSMINDQINVYFINYILKGKKEKYLIFDGNKSTAKFLALTMPGQTAPVKTLNAIKEHGQALIDSYTAPVGKIIYKDKVKEIMTYLDEKYDFSSKVFKDQLAFILLINNSHIHFKSHYFTRDVAGPLEHHIFLYCMNSSDDKPETSFFHELGHALQTRYTYDTKVEPSTILSWIDQLYKHNNAVYKSEEQGEILADLLSIGLMYDSPYEDFMPLSYAEEKFKMVVKKITEYIIGEIKL
jgi:hypothetical protein